MIETSETFDLAVVLEHRGLLGHGASAVGGERPGIRATGHLGQGAVAYRRQRERQHHSTIPRGHRGLRPVPSQADASHKGWRSSRSAAMATCRMAAFRPAALPYERGMRCENAATRKYLTADWLWYWPPGRWSNAWPNTRRTTASPPAVLTSPSTGIPKSRPNDGTPSVPYGTMSTDSLMCGHAHRFTTENASRGPCNAARHQHAARRHH